MNIKMHIIRDPFLEKKVRKYIRAQARQDPQIDQKHDRIWKLLERKMNLNRETLNGLGITLDGHVFVAEGLATGHEVLDVSFGLTDNISPEKKKFLNDIGVGQ